MMFYEHPRKFPFIADLKSVHVYIRACACMCMSVYRSQKKASDPSELGLQAFVSCLVT